jgi:hypothetical protein
VYSVQVRMWLARKINLVILAISSSGDMQSSQGSFSEQRSSQASNSKSM